MAELDDAHRAAQEQAAKVEAQRAEAQAAATRLERLRAQRRSVARRTDPRRPGTDKLKELDAAIADADQALAGARAQAVQGRGELAEVIERFGQLADPTKELPRLDPEIPLLLLPVRLETRFKDGELWVRVYPDDWAVDTFEDQLSDVEVVSARRFWGGLWRAGGDEAMRRAAWQGLVASHGSGRAGWIIQNYAPLNPEGEPSRASGDDVILVVVSDQPLTTTAERRAARRYWSTVWRHVDDAVALAMARAALDEDVGRPTAEAIANRPPHNLDEKPPTGLTRVMATVAVAFCDVPVLAADATKLTSWTQPARAQVLPDRFVLLGYTGSSETLREVGNPVPPTLVVGPDPSAAPEEQFRIENGELVIPDELRWMVDFDEAIKVGLGFRVKLTATQASQGFSRLYVLGVRVAATPDESRAALETLLTHHHHSRTGLSLLPQGSPTNNTDGQAAGFTRGDDADATYDVWLGAGSRLEDHPEPERKQDGQWLAECLGIDAAVLATVPGVATTDQAEARAMNVALWPATWGYFLETMMHPLFEADDIDAVRAFFTRCVSGRGLVPALRIGRQPYGILPTTSLARLGADRGDRDERFLGRLDAVLQGIAADWERLAASAAHVGQSGDPHQTLLDIVGLHPASVEFHQRYAESDEDIYNRFNLHGIGVDFIALWEAMGGIDASRQLLATLGWGGGADPAIIRLLFHGRPHKLKGPVVDDRPLSERDPVRAYTDDDRNYLRWLADAAGSSLETLRRQDGFTGDTVPTALLYLLLRHALLLSWWETGLRFRLEAGALDAAEYKLAHLESSYVHIAEVSGSESRWQALYSPATEVTGNDRVLADVIPQLWAERPARHLAEVVDAIGRLADLPTARLERLLAEHLDCCSYRLDAWRLGLVHHRLLTMRLGAEGALGGPPELRRGIHLGAYGWLEDVQPEDHKLEPVELPDPQLEEAFGDKNRPPLMRDRSNGGFVHAPSLDHAATAAVLRSGFMANSTPAHPDTMAVNLSSERVRLALSVLEGVRGGQSLSALLGYRLERGLHDRHGMAEVDSFIHELRRVFPSPADPEGRQVVDALELLQQIERTGVATYPFDHPGLAPASSDEAAAIDAEIVRLRDVHDAVADVALAEGVHQAVLGNFDRVAANLDAYSKIGFPPEPGVIETPRRGRALTHRVGVHLRPGRSHTASPVTGVPMTPRASAEPAINELLAALLPPPATVGMSVTWTDVAGTGHERVVTQTQLGLQPLDLLHLLRLEEGAALGELDERVLRLVEDSENLRPDIVPEVRFTARVPNHVSFFELAPLVTQLRSALSRSRPLRPTDVMLGNEASLDVDGVAGRVHRARPAAVLTRLQAQRASAVDLVADIDALLADTTANHAALVDGCDIFSDRAIEVLRGAGSFGLGGSGWAEISDRRRALFGDVLLRIADVVARWEPRLAEATARLDEDAALPVTATVEERTRLLVLAEQAVRAAVSNPLPTNPDTYRTTIVGARGLFTTRLDALRAVAPGATSLQGLFATVTGLLPLTAFDATGGLDLAPLETRAVELCRYLRDRVASSAAEADRRITAAQQHLAAHDAAPPGQGRVAAVEAATKALLGEDALVVPEFVLTPKHGDEWDAAMAWSRTGKLTAHLSARAFPVDDWLHGVARVRDKMRCWEQLTMLAGALGRPEPELRPVQLPHLEEPWLALELPKDHVLAGDRLLYTAHYPVVFAKTAAQCGLLLDEWVETIPDDATTTGIAFHYDRPDTEPPQAWLLAVPPHPGAGWQWDDLVATLDDTLALARLRAVEPDDVAATPYGGFLPATVMAATLRGVSISANLALNNNIVQYLRGDDG